MSAGLGVYRAWREPKAPVASSAVAFYDPMVHGRRVREYAHPERGSVLGRKNAKRLGLILSKKQRRAAKRAAAAEARS